MADVFISYPHQIAKYALQLANSLREKGIEAWCAEDNLTSGDDWKTKVKEALKDAQCVIFIFAPDSQPSSWMQEEQMSALESYWAGNKKMFIPVLVGNATPPTFLKQWAAIWVPKKSGLGKAVDQVIKLLRSNAKPQMQVIEKLKKERNERLQKLEKSVRRLRADDEIWQTRRA